MSRHLRPAEARPTWGPGSDRMGPLAKLPVFLELAGKRAVVAGGREAAAWKAELLAAAGACVEVFAADPCPALLALVRTHGIRLTHRAWAPGDLSNAAVAIGDFEDADDAVGFVRAARALRVPVNVIDRPGFCDFQFGAIVNRSPVVIGISTDGAAPVLAQAVRRRIEAILPAALGAWGATAHAFRARLAQLLPAKGARRRFWEAFVDIAFISQAEEDARLAELEELARTIAEDGHGRTPQRGEVILVGAGPGDPELLTLKAVRALQAADVIVHDRLVTPEILELGRCEARRIGVGKHGHGASCRQDDINALLVRLARDGSRVVRLKGGDPSVFGRAGEEIAACQAAGIPVRIVPGVTTALAAAAALESR